MNDFKPIDNDAPLKDDTHTDCTTADNTKSAETLELPSQSAGNKGATRLTRVEYRNPTDRLSVSGPSSQWDNPAFVTWFWEMRLHELEERLERDWRLQAHAPTDGETPGSLSRWDNPTDRKWLLQKRRRVLEAEGRESDWGLQEHAPTDGKTLTSLDKPASASKASQTSEIESTGGTLDADKPRRMPWPPLSGQGSSDSGLDMPAVAESSQTVPPALTADDNQRGGDPDAESSEAL